MNFVIDLLALLAQRAASLEFMTNLLLKTSLIVASAGALSVALRGSTAALRHWVWLLTFAALMVYPLLTSLTPVWQVTVLPDLRQETARTLEAAARMKPSKTLSASGVRIERTFRAQPVNLRSRATPASEGGNQPFTSPGIGTLLVLLWFTGALYFLLRIGLEIGTIAWLARKGETLSGRYLEGELAKCRDRLKLHRKIKVVVTPMISVPLTFGCLRPIVCLPSHAGNWPLATLRTVLIHELTHIKRWDFASNVLAQALCAVYWFHPLVWVAARQMRFERERASDDRVIALGTSSCDYAQHLLDIARKLRTPSEVGHHVIAMARRSELKGRLHYILEKSIRRHSLSRLSALASATLLALLIIPITMVNLKARDHATLPNPPSRAAPDTDLSVLITELDSDDITVQMHAAWALGEREEGEAVAALVEKLSHPNPQTRSIVAWALGEIKSAKAVTPLVHATCDSDVYTREMIAKALGEIEDHRAVVPLIEMLNDDNASVRSAAVWALGEICVDRALTAVLRASRDRCASVRESAVAVLAGSSQKRALDGLLARLHDSCSQVRRRAAVALGESGGSYAVDGLISALKDRNPSVRCDAAEALGKIGEARAVDAILELLRDQDEAVRAKVIWALDEINPSRHKT